MSRPIVPLVSRHFHRLAWLAVALAFGVIVFGAFVRLSNAGLSCPDWPTCYGRAAWPSASSGVLNHAATEIRQLDPSKAWREQTHRHLAATLGFLVFLLAVGAARRRKLGVAQVCVAAVLVALAIPLYMHGQHAASAALAILAEAVLLAAALRWDNTDLARAAMLTFAVIIVQALLGMWTVTWLLKPIVVMGHLLGGFATFALLAWMAWRATDRPIQLADARLVMRWVLAGVLLLAVQIALGGWTSSNYAALSCGAGSWSMSNFPQCAGHWWPHADYAQGFVLWRGIGVDYEGGVLDGQARIAIQLVHRAMALVVFLYMWVLAVRLLRMPGMRGWGVMLALLVSAQVALGIANVKFALPLPVAVGHNAGAALLLFALVTLLARIRPPQTGPAG